jgi:hypothetical protein
VPVDGGHQDGTVAREPFGKDQVHGQRRGPDPYRRSTRGRDGHQLLPFLRRAPPGTADAIPLAVAVLPVFVQEKSGLVPFRCDALTRQLAQFQLEMHGYYALLPSGPPAPVTVDTISAMPATALRDLGSAEAALLLLLTIERVESVNAVIVQSASTRVHARLVSKATRAVLWDSKTTSAATSLGLLPAAFINEKKESLMPALKKLFKQMPPYEGMHVALR